MNWVQQKFSPRFSAKFRWRPDICIHQSRLRVHWLVSPRFSKACAWRPWKTMMVLELHQVKEDIVNSSLVGFFREDQFCELQPLPLFSPTFFHRVGCWHQFFGVFSKSIMTKYWYFWGMMIGEKSLSSAGLVGRFRSHLSQGTTLCSGLVISISWRWNVEKVFIVSIYSTRKRSYV